MKAILFIAALVVFVATTYSQTPNAYEVFAIRFVGPWFAPVSEIAVGTDSKDSVEGCNMIWLLKGYNGRNVLVDAGFLSNDSTKNDGKHIRPDLALEKTGVSVNEITDVIITHPHNDHIGGIDLFPKAMVWMQKDDFDYFVGTAWQKDGFSDGFKKIDVRRIIEINLRGKLTLIKGDSLEIIPGIRVFIGSKHTWESQYVLVNSRTARVIIAAGFNEQVQHAG